MGSSLINKAKEKAILLTKRKWFVYAWLLFLGVICYGILIPWLGFYWDDLPYFYQYSVNGPAGFKEYVASDRPFSWWIFSLTTAVFAYNPTPYHILALLLRWTCGSVFFSIINRIWEKNAKLNLMAASLFMVYPGFLQQPIALIYNHHWTVFLFLLLSLSLMIKSLEGKKHTVSVYIASVILSLGMFSIENFATLELIRPVIIWILLRRKYPKIKNQEIARKTFLYWVPYLLVFLAFITWRTLIFKFPTYKPSVITELTETPMATLRDLFFRIPRDLVTVVVRAWTDTFHLPIVSAFGLASTYLFYTLVVFSFTTGFIMLRMKISPNSKNSNFADTNLSESTFLFGGLSLFLLAGSIPWALDLPVTIEFAWDRMTIAFIPSAALIISGIMHLFKKRPALQSGLFAMTIALAVGSHFINSMDFKRDWDNLNNFFSQLAWRIPSLAENTIVLTSDVGLNYYSDNSLTSPVNLMYSDLESSDRLDYFVYFTNARSEEWFENKDTNSDYFKRYRSFYFDGNTSNSIALQYNPPECMKVLDRTYSNSVTNPNLSFLQVDELTFTNLDAIKTKTEDYLPIPFLALSGTENWCFYFQKADLARQRRDFKTVAQLGNSAIENGFRPRAASEWLPFLEGYLWEGEMEKVVFIIGQFREAEDNYLPGLCYTLDRIKRHPDFPSVEAAERAENDINC